MARRQIALYGKGGIGKSTTSSNLSAALSKLGEKVIQVGCDPKSDSTTTLLEGRMLKTILEETRKRGATAEVVKSVIERGYNGILCAEAGGPKPGKGCAGKGVAIALELITKYGILDENGITFAVYDVLGDVVCGGFAQPMRSGYAREIYLVSSGELMALYAANNIATSVRNMMDEGADVGIGGIIDNQRNVKGETELMEDFAQRIGVPVIAHIRRSELVQAAEIQRRTVVECFPETPIAQDYMTLAERISSNTQKYCPTPMQDSDELMELLRKYQMYSIA